MATVATYPCAQCGAKLEYQPGTTVLRCPYCGHQTPIAPPSGTVDELAVDDFLDRANLRLEMETETVLHCNSCAAEFTVLPNEVTKACPFCGSHVLVESPNHERIRPNAILPFVLQERPARERLKVWLGSLFWAPNDLVKMALSGGRLKGVYLPYWTFDSDTLTHYTGQRGEHYYVSETYTTTVNGQTVTRTRQVRKTRWWPASGVVQVPFDDVLVVASAAVPPEQAQRLRTWEFSGLEPYEERYLVGFQTMRYDVDLANGFATAKEFMQPAIDQTIRADIGGDEQIIHSKDTEYRDNTFKHLLLPVYVGGYQYRGKPYRFVVNGQTGEVQGEAPISIWKVMIAVLLGLLIIGTIVYFSQKSQSGSVPATDVTLDPVMLWKLAPVSAKSLTDVV